MAVKTFTTGEVLTSADTNTYLANSGLVYITSAVVTSAVSSVTIDNCFTSTYDNYLVIGSNIGGSASVDLYCQMRYAGPTTQSTSYYQGIGGITYLGGLSTPLSGNNASAFTLGNITSGGPRKPFNMNVFQTVGFAGITIQTWDSNAGSFYSGAGYINTSRTYTGLIFSTSSGTINAGTFRVYGYRQA